MSKETDIKIHEQAKCIMVKPINSFIEQYICCCSNYFILSRYNDYKKLDDKHIRSTWSSFVYDYRLLKNNNKNNLYLDTLL